MVFLNLKLKNKHFLFFINVSHQPRKYAGNKVGFLLVLGHFWVLFL